MFHFAIPRLGETVDADHSHSQSYRTKPIGCYTPPSISEQWDCWSAVVKDEVHAKVAGEQAHRHCAHRDEREHTKHLVLLYAAILAKPLLYALAHVFHVADLFNAPQNQVFECLYDRHHATVLAVVTHLPLQSVDRLESRPQLPFHEFEGPIRVDCHPDIGNGEVSFEHMKRLQQDVELASVGVDDWHVQAGSFLQQGQASTNGIAMV
mmetsp:Transcript_63769/g.106034  ORF Transcript_63769/g.106034 Transcript_63769/m.106034 type:complete len:208 (+) Transcript_63769:738-1361(+)